ncbi:MAG: HlyC/CorC family transporter [Micavibrio aeruginosavorus]|uniref:HlyC/CorC family transporter n=1 Tax=Micavibrio aeruginosavorus TaxID=349221 RepID=A0A2W5MQQ1_9BACT|nr:MAG: HlyC/CorC family transporter [Micavibrio aeruginosavorus]
MILTEVIIIFVLLLINAYFAMSEIAIVSSSKPLLKQLAKQGSKGAETALALSENPGRFLSTVQVGITLVGILAGAYGGATISEKLAPSFNEIDFIAPHGETVAVALIVTCITYFSVVIGELVPKSFALVHAERLAVMVAGPMKFLSIATHPIVVVLEVSANVLMKVLGVKDKSGEVSDEELKAILSEGAETGVIEKSEHEMLQRVIRLDDRDVKSIMTHRTEVTFIDVNDTIEDIRAKVHEAGHSRYPVIDGSPDELKGIVQAKELLDSALGGTDMNVMAHVKDVLILPESASCLQALESFKRNHINLMVIVDEYGSTQGIVTSADILEAIVGVLPSNYDHDDQISIFQREDGSWLVDGRTPIEEIHLSIGLEQISADEDFDTIAGFVLEHLRKTPKEGATFEAFEHKFEIMDMDGHRIDKILITKIEPAELEE